MFYAEANWNITTLCSQYSLMQTCTNLMQPRGVSRGERRGSSVSNMCCSLESPWSSGECQDMWSPAQSAFSLWKTYRARPCISSAGQVGGDDSPGSCFRRKVSSKPKPLGRPGPDRLQKHGPHHQWLCRNRLGLCSSLMHSAIPMQVR